MILAAIIPPPHPSHLLTNAIVGGAVLGVILLGLFCLKVFLQSVEIEEKIRQERKAEQLAIEAANKKHHHKGESK